MTDCKPLNAINLNVRLIDGSMRSGEPAAEASETTQNHFSDMRLAVARDKGPVSTVFQHKHFTMLD
jgi:hypothetical protein